jgi:DNA repair exonuclease SbcCD ATPase subunit
MTIWRFVAISDLHAHPWAAFAKGGGIHNDRFQRTLTVLSRSLGLAQEKGIPWLFGGDLVHTAGYSLNVVLNELIAVLQRFPSVDKLAVWGNHDARGVGLTRIDYAETVWPSLVAAVPNLHVLGGSRPRVTIGGLSYSGAGAQPSPALLTYAPKSDVGLYHGTVAGSVGPNGYVFQHGLDPAELLKRHRVVVVGDIHHPQQIPAPHGQALLIPGAPEHHNFGDRGEHGWWVVEVPDAADQEPSVVFYPSGSPEFRTVQTAKETDPCHYYRVVEPAEALPENVTGMATVPLQVQQRDVLHGAIGPQLLQAWMDTNPPSGRGDLPVETYLAAARQLVADHPARLLRNIRLQRLTLHNFCSYADATFPVEPGTWLVTGQARDYASNGAGKSTLFEALFWLLFGRTTKGLSGDDVIRWGETTCSVRADLLMDDVPVHIIRSRGGVAPGLEVYEGPTAWTASSVTEMTERLSAFLGITPELFQSLGYFSQERQLLFASASDGQRKDMLADLVGLSAFQEASTAAGAKLYEWEQKIVALDAKLEVVQTGLRALEREVHAETLSEETWEKERAQRLAQAERTLADFDLHQDAYRVEMHTKGMAEHGSVLARKIGELEVTAAQAQSKVVALAPQGHSAEEMVEIINSYQMALQGQTRVQTFISEAERQQVLAERRFAESARVLQEGRCPTCGQMVTPEHKANCLEPLRRDLADVGTRLGNLQAAAERAGVLVADLEAKSAAIKAAIQEDAERAKWVQTQRTCQEQLAQLLDDQQHLSATVRQHVNDLLDQQRRVLADIVGATKREVNPHLDLRKRAELRWGESKTAAEALSVALAEAYTNQQIYSYWQEGFSKQGIQSLLLDEVATAFNQTRGLIIPVLTQGVYDVQFTTRSQTKGGNWRERTAFLIFEHGKPIPYEALSGGQRRRIDVGVMLTLVTVVSHWMQAPGVLGVLVLDEVFSFLDASGAEGLMEALREVQTAVPAIFAISHDPELQALFDQTVTVQQDVFGVSHLLGGSDHGHNGGGDGDGHGQVGRQLSSRRAGTAGGSQQDRTLRDTPTDSSGADDGARVDSHPHRHRKRRLAHTDGSGS